MDGTTWLVDVGVVCPSMPRLLAMGTDRTSGGVQRHQSGEVQGLCALHRLDRREDQRRRAAVRSGALEGDTARVRAARRTALYGVAAALVRQQGYILAHIIVAEIHAPDLAAVGDVGGAGVILQYSYIAVL